MTSEQFKKWYASASLTEKQKLAAAMVVPVKNCRVNYSPRKKVVIGKW